MPLIRCVRKSAKVAWSPVYGTTFGVAPLEHWPHMRHDLLEFESALACQQTDIRLVSNYPFKIQLKENVPIMPKATSLIPKECAWVK